MLRFASLILSLLSIPSLAISAQIDPVTEFRNGQIAWYSTQGESKAQGLNLSVAYPLSWKALAAKDNIVQFIGWGDESRNAYVAIMVDKLSHESVGSSSSILDGEAIRIASSAGIRFLGKEDLFIGNEAAMAVTYSQDTYIDGKARVSNMFDVFFITGDNRFFVRMMFCVFGLQGRRNDLDQLMAHFMPLFRMMIRSVTVQEPVDDGRPRTQQLNRSEYDDLFPVTDNKQQKAAPTEEKEEEVTTTHFVIFIVAILVVTWVVYLSPSLILRYLILRRPISRRSANYAAAGISAFFWLHEVLVRSSHGRKLYNPIMFMLLFWITRWIMVRAPKSAYHSLHKPSFSRWKKMESTRNIDNNNKINQSGQYSARRIVVAVTAVIFVLIGLFPPWLHTWNFQPAHSQKSAGYHFVMTPPQVEHPSRTASGVRIDIQRLSLQWLVLGVASAAAYYVSGRKQ